MIAVVVALVNFGATFGALAFPHADIPHSNFDGHHGPDPADRTTSCHENAPVEANLCDGSPLVSACFATVMPAAGLPRPSDRAPPGPVLDTSATSICDPPGLRPPRAAA